PSPAPGKAPEWVIGSMQTEGQPARMLAGTSANDVWLVRSDEISEFWHWDGLTWTLYPGHVGGDDSSGANQVRSVSVAGQAWASVGYNVGLLRFDGTRWVRVLGQEQWNITGLAGRAYDDVLARD